MAGLWDKIPREFRLLDPGAGVGGLTAAFCERYLTLKSPRHLEVCCFENDDAAAALLDETLMRCQRALRRAGHAMRYQQRISANTRRTSLGKPRFGLRNIRNI